MDDTIVPATIGAGPSAGNAPPPPWQRAARVLLGVAFVLLGLFVLQNFLRALAWAGILAVATWPLYAKLQQRFPPGRHNILLPGLFTLVTTLVVLVPLVIVAYHAAAEARNVATWLHDAREHGIPLPSALAGLPLAEPRVSGWWAANLASPEGAQAWLGRADQELMSFGRAYGGRIAHSIVNFCFTLLALFFLYRDGPALGLQLLGAANTLFGPAGERVGRQMIASIHGTVDGLVLVGLGVGLLLGIAYAIAGVPHAILMGTLTAGAAMVPLASWLVLLLGCLLVLVAGNTIAAIALAAFGIVVIFSADHFVRPSLIGSATRLPFIWVLLGILGGVETFGLLGLFLGPAVMAALILLWREWVGDAKTQSSAKP
jgi:predicted PurR-regulated permease PerM